MMPSDQPHAFEALERRVMELETLVTHLQRDYQTLNSVLTEHVVALDRVSQRLDRLLEQLDQLAARVDVHRDPRDEKPPHY